MDMVRQISGDHIGVCASLGGVMAAQKAGCNSDEDQSGQEPAEPQRMESRGRLALTAQHSLHLIRAGDRELVLAVHPGGVTVVCGSHLGRNAIQNNMRELRIVRGLSCSSPARSRHRVPARRYRWCRAKDPNSLSIPMQIVVLLTLLTVLPAVVMSVTPFLRITVVLHFLRQALGTQAHTFQPGAHRPGAFSYGVDHAAGGHRHVSPRLGADGERPGDLAAGLRRRVETAESVPGPIRSRKRREAIFGGIAHAAAASGRPISA